MPIQTRFPARERTRHAGAVAASTVATMAVALCAALLGGCSSGPTMGAYGAPSAAALMQAQQNDEEKAKLAKPDTRELYLSMIRQVQDQGSYFASLAHIEQFRMQFGSAPDVDILRADALRETGQPDAAEQAYRQLLGSTEAAAAWHGLGLVAAQRKDYAGATQALREAVSRAPTQAFYLSDLGFALLRNGEPAAARVPLAQAAELQPDSKKVLSNLAVYLLVTGDRSRADAMMTNAKMPPSTREAIDKLAADIRAQTKARKQAADAASARAAAQAAAAIAPQAAPPVATASAVATPARASTSSDGPVVVRLPQAGATDDGQNKGTSKSGQAAPVTSASDAKLARAGDGPRSDMPTSMLDRFAHSQ